MTTICIRISPEIVKFQDKEILIEIDGNGLLTDKTDSLPKDMPVFSYFDNLVKITAESGHTGTADNYRCAEERFRKFCKDMPDISFGSLDTDFISKYERHLKHSGLKQTTVSFYMRTLRAMYNIAVKERVTTDLAPFRNVYTAVGATPKRAVSMDTIRRVSRFNCDSRQTIMARDMFLFSFYTRGMAFVDMAFLKKTDIKNGTLTYKRMKTGQTIAVKWEKQMQRIVDTYHTADSTYLLPIITDATTDARRQYKNRQRYVNEKLKLIGRELHLKNDLTMYVARHSWASIAKEMGMPTGIISEALGHTSIKTTQIYLKSIGSIVIDKANAMILKRL